jgi:acyl-CoA synthetase (NDP forming)
MESLIDQVSSPSSQQRVCHCRMTETAVLNKIFHPKSVAIIGASPEKGSPRNTLVRVLIKHGYRGNIYPVNPSHAQIEGLRAFASVELLPEVPDLALVITPAHTVPDVIAQCGAFGIRAAIVYSSGFEETEGGRQHAQRLAKTARENDVAVIGANCQGVWSIQERAMLTFGAASLALQTLRHAPVAVISQSGALAGAIGNYLQTSGIGCSYIVSVGNETCLDLLDVLIWLIEQDDVRVVALYLEGLKDAGRILEIADRARERGVQIVAVKTGRSAVGQQATASHTGKIASSHVVYTDLLDQAGVITLASLGEMLTAVEVLGFLPNPRVSGDPKGGVSVMSSSGGAGALLADHSEEFGIPLAEFSRETIEQFDGILPDFARKANPVDLTGHIRQDPNLFKNAGAAIGADPRTEALIVQFASSGLRDLKENGEVFKLTAKRGGFPMIMSLVAETVDPEMRRDFRQAGIFLSSDPAAAMRALSWLYKRRNLRASPHPARKKSVAARTAPQSWADIMQFCESSTITPAKWKVLGPQDSATTACLGMSYPLVVKVLPSEADHKTELGLIRLRVRSPEEVDRHAAEFRQKLGKPELSVLVQEMVEDGIEVVLSCLRNTDFGPIVSVGTGGIAIELYRDVIHLALPVSPAQVLAALKKLKLWTLLQGFRGKPPGDVEALVTATVQFGDTFLATPELREFEINPLIVRRKGEGVTAVDALIVAKAQSFP